MSVSITDRRKSKFLANLDDNELKCIKVEITWGNITNPNRNGPLERAIEDPRKLNINIHYRPDEGLHPIFARDDIFVNLEETVKAREPEVEKSCTCFSRNRSPQPHSSRSYPECDSCRSSVSKKIVFRRSQESSHDRELLLKRSQERSQQNQERIRERSPGKKERSRERSPKENFERNRERSSRQNRERSREPSIKYHRSDSATESRRSRTPSVRNRERSPSRSRDRSVSNSRVLLSKRRSREKSPNYHRFYSPRGSRRSRTPARRRSRSYSPHRRSRYSRSPDYRHYERSHSPRRYWYTPERERYSRTSSPDERAFPLPRIPNPFNEGPEFWMPDPASQVRFIPPPPLPAPFPCGPFRPPMMPQRPTFWPRIIFDRPPRLTFDQELENFSESFENNQ